MSGKGRKKDALSAALRLLSIRPRSVAELTGRLREKGFGPEEAEGAATALTEAGYLDDEKFARSLSESRARVKNWGPRKISFDLAQRGVAEDIIRKVLDGSGDESDVARSALRKWMKRNPKVDLREEKGKDKANRFLRGRGFSPSVIFRLIKQPHGMEE